MTSTVFLTSAKQSTEWPTFPTFNAYTDFPLIPTPEKCIRHMSLFAKDKTQTRQPRIALILFIEVVLVKYAPFKSQL